MASVNAEAVLLRRHHTVNFDGCENLTDAAAQHLAQCPQLQTVNIFNCYNLTDTAAQHLAQRFSFSARHFLSFLESSSQL